MEKKEKKVKEIPLNLHQKINKIMADVPYIQKTYLQGANYSSVKHDDVTKKLRPALVKYGVVMTTDVLEYTSEIKTIRTQKGNNTYEKLHFVIFATIKVAFIDMDNPRDRFEVTSIGQGIDAQDKAIGKAISYGVKYALLKTFAFETGDDPENDNIDYDQDVQEKKTTINEDFTKSELENIKVSDISLSELRTLIQETQGSLAKYERMLLKSENIKSITDLTEARARRIIHILQNRKQSQKEEKNNG